MEASVCFALSLLGISVEHKTRSFFIHYRFCPLAGVLYGKPHPLPRKYRLMCRNWKKNWPKSNARKLNWTSECNWHFVGFVELVCYWCVWESFQTLSTVGIQFTLYANGSKIYILLVRDVGRFDKLFWQRFGADRSELWSVQIVVHQGIPSNRHR